MDYLIQDQDRYTLEDATITVPTDRKPTDEEWEALKFGWKVVKHVKSNAIVVNDTANDSWNWCRSNESCRFSKDCS